MELAFFENNYIDPSQAKVNIKSLGFSLGATVFEACRVNYNKELNQYCMFRVKDHIDRLWNSMKILRMFPSCNKDELISNLTDLVKKWNEKDDAYLKIIAYISSPSPGSSIFNPEKVETDICAIISKSKWPQEMKTGINVCVSSWNRIHDNVMPPRVKSVCNYENTRLAGYEAVLNNYDNAIFLNNAGRVCEAAESAVFLVSKKHIITPSLSSGILDSITRNTVINRCLNSGYVVEEREVDRSELYLADEMFICNTAKVIRPILSVDRIQIGNGMIGEITRKTQKEYRTVAYGYDKYYLDKSILI